MVSEKSRVVFSMDKVCLLVIVSCALLNGAISSPSPPLGKKPSQCSKELPDSCALCGRYINVVLKAKNVLNGSNFNIEAKLSGVRKQPLLYFLEQAGTISPGFNKFKSTYYKGLGYFIDSINGVEGSVASKTFWHILSGNKALECGVSSYVPEDGETILFNFTTYKAAGYE
ncbi:cobalamin binding intrinsic factor-like [Biomphalaria glabrata]|uniref:Cobalamin binding intrinsic factor-like n=1 Tax=Biomphalaria glabrata TaxID=6526 RepID=A0A9W2ZE78_BIOGL|nr:cobalamin binding intrinsic factor-like [Biomphalaria glabrata]